MCVCVCVCVCVHACVCVIGGFSGTLVYGIEMIVIEVVHVEGLDTGRGQ